MTAAREAGISEITVDLEPGTKREAMLYACGANTQGKARTPEDKRRAVGRLLRNLEWRHWSDHEMARHCGVSHEFVRKLRRSLSTDDSEPEMQRTYVTKHGTIATMDTSRIGRTGAASSTEEPGGSTAMSAPGDGIMPHDGQTSSLPVSEHDVMGVDDAHQYSAEVLETEEIPRTISEAIFPSMAVTAEKTAGAPPQSKTPIPQHELSEVLTLMGKLCLALRQGQNEAPATAYQGWSLELAHAYVHTCSDLIEQLQAFKQALEHHYLATEQGRVGKRSEPSSSEPRGSVPQGDTPESRLSAPAASQTASPPAGGETEQASPRQEDRSGSEGPPMNGKRTLRERVWAFKAAGLEPDSIVERLNAEEGRQRYTRGAVLAMLRAKSS